MNQQLFRERPAVWQDRLRCPPTVSREQGAELNRACPCDGTTLGPAGGCQRECELHSVRPSSLSREPRNLHFALKSGIFSGGHQFGSWGPVGPRLLGCESVTFAIILSTAQGEKQGQAGAQALVPQRIRLLWPSAWGGCTLEDALPLWARIPDALARRATLPGTARSRGLRRRGKKGPALA